MLSRVPSLHLEAVVSLKELGALSSPRGRSKFRAQSSTIKREICSPRAVQASSLLLLPKKSPHLAADDDADKEVIYELRQQVESIWHEYAAARRRNLKLQESNESLQSQIHNLTKALRQEEINKMAVQKQPGYYRSAAQECHVEDTQ